MPFEQLLFWWIEIVIVLEHFGDETGVGVDGSGGRLIRVRIGCRQVGLGIERDLDATTLRIVGS